MIVNITVTVIKITMIKKNDIYMPKCDSGTELWRMTKRELVQTEKERVGMAEERGAGRVTKKSR